MATCDCVDRDLLVIKATFFFFMSGVSCITPYIAVYMRQLGLQPSQTGVILSAKNFVTALVKPMLGSIADKTGRPKAVAVFTVLTGSVLHFSLLFVPPVSTTANVTSEATQQPNKKGTGSLQSWFSLTFWLVFWILPIAHGVQWSSVAQVDAATYQIIKKNNRGDYGRQRLWGSVGFATFSFVSSVAMDALTDQENPDNPGNKTDFSVAFYMFLAFMLVLVVCLLISNDWSTGPSTAVMKGMVKLFSQLQFFLLAVLLLGAYDGAADTFLFWHLKDLGASQTVLGTCTLVRTLAEIPFYFISGWIVDTLGHARVLAFGFVAYGLRFLLYLFIHSPWWAIAIEILNGYTAATWTAATSYASISAQDDLQAFAQGVTAVTFYGLGHGVGNLISGQVFNQYGARVLFRSMAVSCLIGFILFCLLYWCFRRKDIPVGDYKTDGENKAKETLLPSTVSIESEALKPGAFLRGGRVTNKADEQVGILRIVRPQAPATTGSEH